MRFAVVVAAALALAASAGAASVPGLQVCFTGKTVVRPASITIACGDGNFFVTKLRWSSWNATGARATGVGHENDCKPYCAAGHFHAYAVSVRLSRPKSCAAGKREFARIDYRFVGAKPAGVPRTGFVPAACG